MREKNLCDLSGILAEHCRARQWQIKSANTNADAATKTQIQVLRYKLKPARDAQPWKQEAKKCKCESQPMPNDPQLETGQKRQAEAARQVGGGQ